MSAPLLLKNGLVLRREHPYLVDFFASLALPFPPAHLPLAAYLTEQVPDDAERGTLIAQLIAFADGMAALQAQETGQTVGKVTLLGGRDKSGDAEALKLELRPGDVICVVGPTGSGKSRLLADIECLAQGDTPSGRRIHIDDAPIDDATRLSGEQRLVAQLSQNMNFVMDLSVREFIAMHAESRLHSETEKMVETVFAMAVELAGEPFTLETPVTALSGGQSRALMIADVACLSASPIVLVDEIENAGVDRRKALELLVRQEKIVVMATHDPLLALRGDKRLVIRHGAVASVVVTSEDERSELVRLDVLDRRLAALREQVRRGERITSIDALLAPL
ncbi:MAG: ABC transporter [Desulfuromonas sp.]|nr:MAG: ABC transporter [Desulfuromonas sp.]